MLHRVSYTFEELKARTSTSAGTMRSKLSNSKTLGDRQQASSNHSLNFSLSTEGRSSTYFEQSMRLTSYLALSDNLPPEGNYAQARHCGSCRISLATVLIKLVLPVPSEPLMVSPHPAEPFLQVFTAARICARLSSILSWTPARMFSLMALLEISFALSKEEHAYIFVRRAPKESIGSLARDGDESGVEASGSEGMCPFVRCLDLSATEACNSSNLERISACLTSV